MCTSASEMHVYILFVFCSFITVIWPIRFAIWCQTQPWNTHLPPRCFWCCCASHMGIYTQSKDGAQIFNVPFFMIHGKETMKWTKQKQNKDYSRVVHTYPNDPLAGVGSVVSTHRPGLGGPRISTSTWTQSISSFQLSAPKSQREKPRYQKMIWQLWQWYIHIHSKYNAYVYIIHLYIDIYIYIWNIHHPILT